MTDQWLQFARFLYKKRGRRVCNLRYLLVVFHWKPFTAIAENNCDTIILSVECFVFKLAFVVARHSPVTFHMFVQRTSKLSLDINGKGYTKPPRCRHTINSISFFLSYRCSLRSHWILHNGVCDGWSTGDAERGGYGTTLLLHKTFKGPRCNRYDRWEGSSRRQQWEHSLHVTQRHRTNGSLSRKFSNGKKDFRHSKDDHYVYNFAQYNQTEKCQPNRQTKRIYSS